MGGDEPQAAGVGDALGRADDEVAAGRERLRQARVQRVADVLGEARAIAPAKIGMILPRRPITPRIQGISVPIGSAYSSLPSGKTTS